MAETNGRLVERVLVVVLSASMIGLGTYVVNNRNTLSALLVEVEHIKLDIDRVATDVREMKRIQLSMQISLAKLTRDQ